MPLPVALAFVPLVFEMLGKASTFTGLITKFTSHSKQVAMFHLGDWVRLRIGGTAIVTRKKTLLSIPNTLLTRIVEEDVGIAATVSTVNKVKTKLTETITQITTGNATTDKKDAEKQAGASTTPKNITIDEKKVEVEIEGQAKKVEGLQIAEKQIAMEEISENDEEKKVVAGDGRVYKLTFEKDQEGYWMIDRDPKYFMPILNFLRTKQLNYGGCEPPGLLCEAKFYRIAPLVDAIQKQILDERRMAEKKEVMSADSSKESSPYFFVSSKWIADWHAFVFEEKEPPPAIQNQDLMQGENQLRTDLEASKDYVALKKDVWVYLWGIYGGGPIISRLDKNIYSENVLSDLWRQNVVYNQIPLSTDRKNEQEAPEAGKPPNHVEIQ